MEYTIQDIQKLKMIFGEKFDPFGTSNSRSDFSRITLSTIAKGLANYTKNIIVMHIIQQNLKAVFMI